MIRILIRLLSWFVLLFKIIFTSQAWEHFLIRIRKEFNQSYWEKRLKYLGDDILFYKYVVIHSPEKVSIKSHSRIGDYVLIWGGGEVEIGEGVLIAAHSVITSEGHDPNAESIRDSSYSGKVIIKDNVWLGAGVYVMPGVTISENCVIGAGSIVTKDIPANSISIGNPAKVIKTKD
ncbi:MAG: acyltransferase [Ignavibacteriae bacterium]|nr:acyltransferase [Ignavibacteriota bacterium]